MIEGSHPYGEVAANMRLRYLTTVLQLVNLSGSKKNLKVRRELNQTLGDLGSALFKY